MNKIVSQFYLLPIQLAVLTYWVTAGPNESIIELINGWFIRTDDWLKKSNRLLSLVVPITVHPAGEYVYNVSPSCISSAQSSSHGHLDNVHTIVIQIHFHNENLPSPQK